MKKIFSAHLTIDFVSSVEFEKYPSEIEIIVENKPVRIELQNILILNTQQVYLKISMESQDLLLPTIDDYLKIIKTIVEKVLKAEVDSFGKIEDLICLTSDEEASIVYSVDLVEDILMLKNLLNEIVIIETKIGPSLKTISECRTDFKQDNLIELKLNLGEMKPKLEKILAFIKKIS